MRTPETGALLRRTQRRMFVFHPLALHQSSLAPTIHFGPHESARRVESPGLHRLFHVVSSVLAFVMLMALGACGGGGSSPGASFLPLPQPAAPASPPTLVSIQVDPANPSLAAGTSVQLTATAIYSDNTHGDVTSTAAWSTANGAVASVDASGKALGAAPGTSMATASFGGQSGSTTLTVTPATVVGMEITPRAASIAKGAQARFVVMATFSDHTTQNISADVDWRSSPPAVATVDGTGLASGVAPGQATITASCRLARLCASVPAATATLDVSAASLASLAVTPANPSIALGTAQQFTAIGTYSDQTTQDLTTQVNWASNNLSTASVNAQGLATSATIGRTDITADLGGVKFTTTLTITPARLASIAMTPPSATATIGGTSGGITRFTATGTYTDGSTQDITARVTWASDTDGVATISNAALTAGFATSVAQGTATISAALGSVSTSGLLTVEPKTIFSASGPAIWKVPAGVHLVRVVALGGGGGAADASNRGGNGGQVTAQMAVTPGETLTLFVGGGGRGIGNGGVGGGGDSTTAGSGGGATTLQQNASVLFIAGGGGGAGASAGGTDGGDGGGNGLGSGAPGSGVGFAGGGANGSGGTAGAGTISAGSPGSSANGGAGSSFGGGGGGGFGGGGGGGFNGNYGGGGGGGGSAGPAGSTYAVGANGATRFGNGGDGSITVSY